MQRLYCDFNATTPVHPQVLARMLDVGQASFGNPSSIHSEGRKARQVLEQARAQVAALLSAHKSEIVFTSGGTEANNLALRSAVALLHRLRGRSVRIVSSRLEHPSVRQVLQGLADQGHTHIDLPCDSQGRLSANQLAELLKEYPADLVSFALCNHELGNLYPIAELTAVAHAHGALVHCDAVQAVGRVPVSVQTLDVDLLSLSGHKLFGPKGVGALYVRTRRAAPSRAGRDADPSGQRTTPSIPALTELAALLHGGPQERGLRPGTENVLGIVGLGQAAVLACDVLLADWQALAARRDDLEARVLSTIADARVQGCAAAADSRAPGTSNLAFAGVEGELLLMNLDLRGIAVSTGSACSSGSVKPSSVILALGQSEAQAREAIRVSLGPDTTSADIGRLVAALAESVAQVRAVK